MYLLEVFYKMKKQFFLSFLIYSAVFSQGIAALKDENIGEIFFDDLIMFHLWAILIEYFFQ